MRTQTRETHRGVGEPFRRAIVIGSPGAGKSVFARALRDRTGLPLYYLDQIWHKPDKTNVSREEFDAKLREILAKDRWILDGNYQRTLRMRLERCDAVFLLDYPKEVCLAGAAARIGTKREDMPWVEEELDGEFRQWIEDFPETQLPAIYRLLEEYPDRQITVFKSRAESERWLADCSQEINPRYAQFYDLPYPESVVYPYERMPMSDRAAQFASFQALTGYEEAVDETARLTDARIERDERTNELLNAKMRLLQAQIAGEPEVTVTYFVPDEKKAGGRYVTESGAVRRMDGVARLLWFTDNRVIPLDDIYALDGNVFEALGTS